MYMESFFCNMSWYKQEWDTNEQKGVHIISVF